MCSIDATLSSCVGTDATGTAADTSNKDTLPSDQYAFDEAQNPLTKSRGRRRGGGV